MHHVCGLVEGLGPLGLGSDRLASHRVSWGGFCSRETRRGHSECRPASSRGVHVGMIVGGVDECAVRCGAVLCWESSEARTCGGDEPVGEQGSGTTGAGRSDDSDNGKWSSRQTRGETRSYLPATHTLSVPSSVSVTAPLSLFSFRPAGHGSLAPARLLLLLLRNHTRVLTFSVLESRERLPRPVWHYRLVSFVHLSLDSLVRHRVVQFAKSDVMTTIRQRNSRVYGFVERRLTPAGTRWEKGRRRDYSQG